MGVVTWATVKCELIPEIKRPFFVAAQRLEDLFGFAYELTKQGYGEELFIANRVQLAALAKETGFHDSLEETTGEPAPMVPGLLYCRRQMVSG